MKKLWFLLFFIVIGEWVYSQCPAPTNMYVSTTTATSATVGWTSGGSSNWQIEYGLIGFNLGNGTRVNTSSNPIVLTNLAGATTFHAYVRDTCSNGSKSSWLGPLEFNTGCTGVSQAPLFENFESSNWEEPTTWNSPGVLAACWVATPSTSGFGWTVGPPFFSTTQTGPSGDHTTGSGKFLNTDNFAFGNNTDAIIRSPRIDISSVTNPQVTFWYHMYGSDISSMTLDVKDANQAGGWTTVWTKTGAQQNSSTAAWLQATVSLGSFAGDTIFLRFKGTRGSAFGQFCEMGIDDLGINQGPSCPSPSNLSLVSKTPTTVTINWTTGGASNWQIEYGSAGFTQGNGTLINPVTSKPHTISGLSSAASYDFYVRDSCTSSDQSPWLGPLTVVTECAAQLAPFSENFDNNPWVSPAAWNQVGSIDNCWKRSLTTDPYYFDAGPPAFTNNFTGPPGDHTTGNGQYLMTELVSFSTGTLEANIRSPYIDLSPLTTPEFTYWYHMFGAGIGTLKTQIDTGSGWITLKTYTGQQQTAKNDAWIEEIINLSAYANKTIRIRFYSSLTSFSSLSEIGIDDFDIHEQPSCPKPNNLSSGLVSNSTANISWTSGGASDYIVKYSSGTTNYVTSNSTTKQLTGLTSNTVYQIWVRDSCGSGDVSEWIGPIKIRTDCDPIAAPYSEDFEGNTWAEGTGAFNDPGDIDPCWDRSDTANYFWKPNMGSTPIFNSGPDVDHTLGTASGQFLFTRTFGFNGNAFTEMNSPWIDLSSLSSPELEFWYHMYGNQISALRVFITPINGNKTLVSTISGQQQTSSTAAWLSKTIALSAYAGDTVKITFRGVKTSVNSWSSDIAIDDIDITDAVCLDPSNLAVSNIKSTTADVSWTTSNSNSNLQYDLSGFSLGSGNLVFNASSVAPLSGLLPYTSYDVYVKDSCGATNTSNWIGPVTFTTDCDTIIADYIYSTNNLLADFDANPSTGTQLTYDWDFGDGNNANGAAPSHVYASAGSYNVQLIVTDPCGNTDTIVQTIQVCAPPIASFTYIKNGFNVDFDASASVNANTYTWDFGDGNNGSGQTPSHTYSVQGSVTVTLIVENICGESDTTSITFDLCDKPTAYFEFKIIQSNGSGMLVDFDGTGSIGANSFLWIFGDGTTNNTSATPSHLYPVPGLFYEVSLIVYSSCGDSDTMKVTMSEVFGVDEWNDDQIFIYPNPVSETLFIEGLNEIDANYQWFDASGKTISLNNENSNGMMSFDVRSLKPGFYILMLFNDSGQNATYRIIVE